MNKSADGGYLPAIAELARMSYAGEGLVYQAGALIQAKFKVVFVWINVFASP